MFSSVLVCVPLRCGGKEGLVPSNFLSSASSNQEKGQDDMVEMSPMHDACRYVNLGKRKESPCHGTKEQRLFKARQHGLAGGVLAQPRPR